jgi:hypothetical protein
MIKVDLASDSTVTAAGKGNLTKALATCHLPPCQEVFTKLKISKK